MVVAIHTLCLECQALVDPETDCQGQQAVVTAVVVLDENLATSIVSEQDGLVQAAD